MKFWICDMFAVFVAWHLTDVKPREDKIKEDVQATSRCMPFEQEHLSDVCVCCGKPAKKMVYWGRAY